MKGWDGIRKELERDLMVSNRNGILGYCDGKKVGVCRLYKRVKQRHSYNS